MKFNKVCTTIVICFLIMFSASVCKSEDNDPNSFVRIPKGFGGIIWRQNIDSINDMALIYTDPSKREKIYKRKVEFFEYGDAKILTIKYFFLDDKFAFVELVAKGEKNAEKIYDEIVQRHGLPCTAPHSQDINLKKIRWSPFCLFLRRMFSGIAEIHAGRRFAS